MKNKLVYITVVIIFIAAKGDIYEHVKFTSKGVDLSNVVVAEDARGNELYKLADLTYAGTSDPYITDLVLSFNSPASYLIKDDTDKYNISFSSYNFIQEKGEFGSGAAAFFKNEHQIIIETAKNLWLGSCDDLGSFTIEMRLFPISLKDESILFSRVGYLSGRKSGIKISFKNNRMSIGLYNVFKNSRGRRYDLFMNRGAELKEKRWYHFALSFDRISGKLVKYIDGQEDEVIYVSQNGDPYVGVHEPSFACTDLPPAIMGKNYFGYLDELRISYHHIDDLKKETDIAFRRYKKLGLKKRTPINRLGTISSPVYSFGSTGTSVLLFEWENIIRENTFVWMEFRISDELFERDDNSPKWYRIDNREKNIYLKKVEKGYLRGNYYQWRAYLVPSPEGENSPAISNIELRYRVDNPPKAPLFLEVKSAGDRHIRLRWMKNHEFDIYGYKIYYGVMSRRYDGVIEYVNKKRLSNEFNPDKNYIEVNLKNSVIEENRRRDKKGVLAYPEIKNSVLYFFSVSAYDSYKPDTPYNHESPQSTEVKARPFAGSEIKER